jgi:hypothetical protein
MFLVKDRMMDNVQKHICTSYFSGSLMPSQHFPGWTEEDHGSPQSDVRPST